MRGAGRRAMNRFRRPGPGIVSLFPVPQPFSGSEGAPERPEPDAESISATGSGARPLGIVSIFPDPRGSALEPSLPPASPHSVLHQQLFDPGVQAVECQPVH